VLHQWRTSRPATPFILIAGHDFDSALVFPPISAAECIRRPINSDELLRRIAGRISVSRNQSDRGASHSSNGESDSRRETLESRPPAIVIPPGATLSDLESAAIEQSLERHQGNRTHAAKALGISVRTLQRKLKAWKVSPPTANVRRDPETAPRDNWTTNGEVARGKTLKPRLATI
jgi:DNA-binding NtrC family response regulator